VDTAKTLTNLFQRSLPIQAREAGPAGIAFNAVMIALANRFFHRKLMNRNVNTASETELIAALKEDVVLAQAVLECRQASQCGYRSPEELEHDLQSRPNLPTGWRERLANLEYRYAAATVPVRRQQQRPLP
jgi:hypothetical protein